MLPVSSSPSPLPHHHPTGLGMKLVTLPGRQVTPYCAASRGLFASTTQLNNTFLHASSQKRQHEPSDGAASTQPLISSEYQLSPRPLSEADCIGVTQKWCFVEKHEQSSTGGSNSSRSDRDEMAGRDVKTSTTGLGRVGKAETKTLTSRDEDINMTTKLAKVSDPKLKSEELLVLHLMQQKQQLVQHPYRHQHRNGHRQQQCHHCQQQQQNSSQRLNNSLALVGQGSEVGKRQYADRMPPLGGGRKAGGPEQEHEPLPTLQRGDGLSSRAYQLVRSHRRSNFRSDSKSGKDVTNPKDKLKGAFYLILKYFIIVVLLSYENIHIQACSL
ncbi:unnamed protein product [Protopolystoma xenopodis]|uniref:Uncharacterized protein n=1 Tax=Protopolystoma xenopodis TaxID=117903 RepID=A0A448WXH0_9PLAT|nr:unnamed protein product [Protopolystoma xenopodis]